MRRPRHARYIDINACKERVFPVHLNSIVVLVCDRTLRLSHSCSSMQHFPRSNLQAAEKKTNLRLRVVEDEVHRSKNKVPFATDVVNRVPMRTHTSLPVNSIDRLHICTKPFSVICC